MSPRGVRIFSAPPGAPLLIEGPNLGTSGAVAFDGIPAPTPASWSPTEILVTVPAASSYPFQGPVTVTTGGQTAQGNWFTIATVGAEIGQISYPATLAVDGAGHLYVADTGNDRVQVYTPSGAP
jgi:hypothetical protein